MSLTDPTTPGSGNSDIAALPRNARSIHGQFDGLCEGLKVYMSYLDIWNRH